MSALAAYEAGLLGAAECWVHGPAEPARRLDLHRWRSPAGPDDEALLAAAVRDLRDPVLDVGCGPGRLTAALAERGAWPLGIDISGVAIALARRRGVLALVRDVFRPLPGEGRWRAVLVADGNIGIGGDPVALLARTRDLLAVGGRVVADVLPTGGVRRGRLWLGARTAPGRSLGGPLEWASVGADAVAALGPAAGLSAGRVSATPTGQLAVWEREW